MSAAILYVDDAKKQTVSVPREEFFAAVKLLELAKQEKICVPTLSGASAAATERRRRSVTSADENAFADNRRWFDERRRTSQ